jgi:hypothetical protein
VVEWQSRVLVEQDISGPVALGMGTPRQPIVPNVELPEILIPATGGDYQDLEALDLVVEVASHGG